MLCAFIQLINGVILLIERCCAYAYPCVFTCCAFIHVYLMVCICYVWCIGEEHGATEPETENAAEAEGMSGRRQCSLVVEQF